MARLLITGGAGYVGSHCTKALQCGGHDCIVFDNLSSGHRDFVGEATLVPGDIRNAHDLDALFARFQFDAVLHFAGLSSVAESMSFPERYFDNNVRGTELLLQAMAGAEVKAIVFSSSCAVYGSPREQPISETAPLHPINPYGETKLLCERMLERFGASGLRSVSLRYFNAAGADPDGEIGEDHENESRLIPLAFDAATGRRPPLTLYGSTFDTEDGTAVRDFVHVCDLASAHIAALNHLLSGGKSQALNLGTAKGFSVRQVLEEIARVIGRPVPVRIAPARSGDPPVLRGDARKAQEIFAWRPHRSSLTAMIGDAWRWHQKRFGPETVASKAS